MSGSLKSFANYRSDALAFVPSKPFVPEDIRLGAYTFMPWARTGLVAGVGAPAAGAARATVDVSVTVQDDAATPSRVVTKSLTLRGPGDVLGFDPAQVVRRYPAPGTTNAETTFRALVEFDRPDFPWMFSPFAPQADRLAPWLALIVVEQREALFQPERRGRPPTVTVRVDRLHSLADAWAWVHAQVIGGPSDPGASVDDRLGDAYGPANLSRLLCPTPLGANKGYVACVVPAFDAGVQAAFGRPGTLAPAWSFPPANANDEVTLPVYDRWSFATAEHGDFKSLAAKLEGIPAPWSVGRRILDASNPGGDLLSLRATESGRIQVIRCALTAPSGAARPADAFDDETTWTRTRTEELRTSLNLPSTLATLAAGGDDLPLIGPRIYARYPRGQNTVDGKPPGDWFDEVNLLPTRRVVAGVGARIVRKDRELLLQSAWAQVGALEAANRELRRIQVARYVGGSLHERHFSALSAGGLAQATRGLHGKVRLDGDAVTVRARASDSALAPAALSGTFRRMTRVRGPMMRYLDGAGRQALARLIATGPNFRDHRRPYVEPDGVVTLSEAAVAAIPVDLAARVLGVDESVAHATLASRAVAMAATPGVADRLMAGPATWGAPARDLGEIAAQRALALVTAAMPRRVEDDPARAAGLVSLLAGIANGGTRSAERAAAMASRVVERLPMRDERPPVEGGERYARPYARFETTSTRRLGAMLGGAAAVDPSHYAKAMASFARDMDVAVLPPTPARPPFVLARDRLLERIRSGRTVTDLAKARLGKFPAWLASDWFDDERVEPLMAAPVFTRPMFEAVDAYDRDWLVPGLGRIPSDNFVTLLETNPVFLEACLVGLSDEMGRHLLFHDFPTDQRATYFRRFWTADEDELAQDLHRFSRTPLGTHLTASAGGATPTLVFVVRGELVRRYPDMIAMALRAGGNDAEGRPVFVDPASDPTAVARLRFQAVLPPDILLCGFALTEADLAPGRWWFVIAEHPTAPRFASPSGSFAHAGLYAADMFRNPVRAAFDAAALVAAARA